MKRFSCRLGGTMFLIVLAAAVTSSATDVTTGSQAGGGFKNEPQGFGKVKLNTGLPVVLAEYPKAEKQKSQKPEDEKSPISFYDLDEPQSVGTTACKMRFQFWREKLTHIHVRECADKDAVKKYLTDTYGQPTQEEKNFWFWKGKETNISYSPLSSDFIVMHRAFSESLAGTLFLQSLGAKPKAEGNAEGGH